MITKVLIYIFDGGPNYESYCWWLH